jgi:hypothetical protein
MDRLLNLITSGEYEKIEGWCSKEKAIMMASFIKSDFLCVELGVFGGRSLLPIAFATNNKVFGIDAWSKENSLEGVNAIENDDWWGNLDHDYFYDYTRNLLEKHGCGNVQLLRAKSAHVVDHFQDESIDFLHQDSNHSEETSCDEVEKYHSKVKKNGIWVFDDTNWTTTRKAQGLLESHGFMEIYDSGSWKIYKKKNL